MLYLISYWFGFIYDLHIVDKYCFYLFLSYKTKYFSNLEAMPYYRILVWTKIRKAPFVGIRIIDNPNINAVYNLVHGQAYQNYRDKLLDIEVQMLSKLCKAIKDF